MYIDKMPGLYSVGTASVEAGSVTVTPTGALWSGNVWGDDLFFLPSQPLVPPQRVKEVNGDGTLTLAFPWPGVAAAAEPYEVRYVGIIERSTAQTRRVLEQLGDVKAWYDIIVTDDAARLALETPSKPLPANYRVIVEDTNFIWAKKSGAYGDWIGPVEFKGDPGTPGEPGPYTDITFGPVTTGAAGSDATASQVVTGPAAIRIDLTIPKGADGAGTGDFVGPAGGVADGDLVAFADATGKRGRKASLVSNSQLANVPTATFKGRVAAGMGDPQDLTAAQVWALLGGASAVLRCVLTGTADAIALASPIALSAGLAVRFRATATNTGSATIAYAGGAAVACRTVTGVALPAGYIRTDVDTIAIYDGTYWVLDRQIERGSNANGEYARYADGTQETWLYHQSGASGGAILWTYPAAFSSAPRPFGTAIGTVAKFVLHEVSTTTSVTMRVMSQAGGADTSWLSLFAIGRWY